MKKFSIIKRLAFLVVIILISFISCSNEVNESNHNIHLSVLNGSQIESYYPAFSSFLGGSNDEATRDLEIFEDVAYIVGQTESSNFPAGSAPNSAYKGGISDGFISKINLIQNSREWSICVGGSGTDKIYAVDVASNGYICIAGETTSANFPIIDGIQQSISGGYDAFVLLMTPEGGIVWSTFLGGSGTDKALALAFDSEDNIIVVGETISSNFPILNPYQANKSNSYDVFVTKFNNSGEMVWSTYLGGYKNENAACVSVDENDNIYFAGTTESTNFPIVGGYQSSHTSGKSGFVVKMDPDGDIVWSTYLNGGGDTMINCLEIGQNGLIVGGKTSAQNIPIFNPFQSQYGGGEFDGLIVEYSLTGYLLFSSYLGGIANDEIFSITIDGNNSIYATGMTESFNFPLKNAYMTESRSENAFIVKVNSERKMDYSTLITGSQKDLGKSIEYYNDELLVAGHTNSGDFINVNGFQPDISGSFDAFFLRMDFRIEYLPCATELKINEDSNFSIGYVKIEWNMTQVDATYLIYREEKYISDIDSISPIAEINSSFYSENLTNGTYYYAVVVSNSTGLSPTSNNIEVTITIEENILPVESNESTSEGRDVYIYIFYNSVYLILIIIVGFILIILGIKLRNKKFYC